MVWQNYQWVALVALIKGRPSWPLRAGLQEDILLQNTASLNFNDALMMNAPFYKYHFNDQQYFHGTPRGIGSPHKAGNVHGAKSLFVWRSFRCEFYVLEILIAGKVVVYEIFGNFDLFDKIPTIWNVFFFFHWNSFNLSFWVVLSMLGDKENLWLSSAERIPTKQHAILIGFWQSQFKASY